MTTKMMFSVHDAVTDTFSTPFAAVNEADANRMVLASMKPGNQLYDNAGDFSVYFVGEFSVESGELQSTIPVLSIRCSSLRSVLDESSE